MTKKSNIVELVSVLGKVKPCEFTQNVGARPLVLNDSVRDCKLESRVVKRFHYYLCRCLAVEWRLI